MGQREKVGGRNGKKKAGKETGGRATANTDSPISPPTSLSLPPSLPRLTRYYTAKNRKSTTGVKLAFSGRGKITIIPGPPVSSPPRLATPDRTRQQVARGSDSRCVRCSRRGNLADRAGGRWLTGDESAIHEVERDVVVEGTGGYKVIDSSLSPCRTDCFVMCNVA
ncbi:hypothetical protein E2C01_022000 [Portunus trituberculatus]|uniref:Uncharacterized protein n=1 Tax=Portunus trituberculatus TaxID=210409 RepID=A0A5B7E5V2_PORTR|nr:hypothetical protein [Portunus trituberculatus]